jgi:hypothetical protein
MSISTVVPQGIKTLIIVRRNTVSIIIAAAAIGAVIIAFLYATDDVKSLFYGNQVSVGSAPSLLLIQRIPIPNVIGRIDHMAVEEKSYYS